MIDINELRRLAQAVSGWGNCNQTWLDQSEDIPAVVVGHISEDGETYPVATIDCDQYYAADQSLPLGKFYAAANPAVINEILNRLEAAEEERDALRAKIKAMERQEPLCWAQIDELEETVSGVLGFECPPYYTTSLYLAPGAQPALIEQDTSVRKAWARFSNELHRSPDAPYPGMADAFEQHFAQSFTDREWRAESATWAAAWKAAKRHGAQPAPSGLDVDTLAQFIRKVDGAHQLGAVMLAERIADWLAAAPEAKP